jgi:Raf kinase inhibitor-like YbhB/YbcL family protein
MSFAVSSSAFKDSERIPIRYAREGENVSPPIAWSNLPEGTKELALICEDPDAPKAEPFVHWIAWNIHPDAGQLPEGIPQRPHPKGTPIESQGRNSFKDIGYDGPAPPPGHGTHHYHFRLYALDRPLELREPVDHKSLIASMSGHILDTGELIGTYAR